MTFSCFSSLLLLWKLNEIQYLRDYWHLWISEANVRVISWEKEETNCLNLSLKKNPTSKIRSQGEAWERKSSLRKSRQKRYRQSIYLTWEERMKGWWGWNATERTLALCIQPHQQSASWHQHFLNISKTLRTRCWKQSIVLNLYQRTTGIFHLIARAVKSHVLYMSRARLENHPNNHVPFSCWVPELNFYQPEQERIYLSLNENKRVFVELCPSVSSQQLHVFIT